MSVSVCGVDGEDQKGKQKGMKRRVHGEKESFKEGQEEEEGKRRRNQCSVNRTSVLFQCLELSL